jgi:hypothetical protein
MEVKDQVYSFEIARRSVGRAALHLGVGTMSESCLDVLADVLLQYLNRTGTALAHLVESSGRTSCHVNVLDALQACHVVASPAVQRLHLAPEDDATQLFGAAATASGSTGGAAAAVAAASDDANHAMNSKAGSAPNHTAFISSSSFGQDSSTDWKGLATFCFGPKWMEEEQEMEGSAISTSAAAAAATTTTSTAADVGSAIDDMMELDSDEEEKNESTKPGGGKQGPSEPDGGRGTGSKRAAGDEDDEDEEAEGGLAGLAKKRKNKGWNAPYLDDISDYPQASETCANPHNLPARTKLSLHFRKIDIDALEAEEEEEVAQEQLANMPDGVFAKSIAVANQIYGSETSFGTIKRKHDRDGAEKDDNDVAPPTKRVKLNDGKAAGTATVPGTEEAAQAKRADDPTESQMPPDFSYVPTFYPPPPSTKEVVERGRTVVDLQYEQQKLLLQQQKDFYNPAAAAAASSSTVTPDRDLEDSHVVRSSLVNMGQFYWGSGWDSNTTAAVAAVPMGRPPSAPTEPTYEIRPMDKPSGTRVTRILEGSMDAAAMQ